MASNFKWFPCILSLVLSTGCAWFGPAIELKSLTLDVASRANDDLPIAVDFVAVTEPRLLETLAGISARQWFAEREQYRRDHPHMLSVWSLELVPGQFMDARDFPFSGQRAAGLLVFADYATPGAHRLRLEGRRKVWLRFDGREMRVLEVSDR
ncbi:type VI secretion protein [Stutzerimonas kirkiae]|uniref:Type VI secretion protein n=1 Tax=Stutzerimonas kirkiae TaxID=2211392 RepID=A0A4Q9R174_9GAMM|nr:type VI secretion protein [Stutzerimonas kirkiae]TBU91638.1 type VI secretion protein [Stutzerimonas kirkiae]TBV00636.1 type VI secretion protein [Stutzerimonas kirkiae]TBV10812.1 type VI secretion protein [Stutzerimonas kirkiae]